MDTLKNSLQDLKDLEIIQSLSNECKYNCKQGYIVFQYEGRIASYDCPDCRTKKIEDQKFNMLLKAADCEDYKHMTLENYIPQNNQQVSAIDIINKSHGSYYLTGPWGTGKTHLMAGTILRAINDGIQSVLISVPELLRQMRKMGRDDKATIEDLAQDIPYLCLDDLGKQKDSDWTDERMFSLIDARYKSFKAGKSHTSFTSNFTLKDLSGKIDGAIIDRIKGMTIPLYIAGESFRGKR